MAESVTTDAAIIALLPCPFCGQTEFLEVLEDGYDSGNAKYHVVCVARIAPSGCGSSGSHSMKLEDAISSWNRRDRAIGE